MSSLESDFMAKCEEYSPSINAALEYLKYEEISFCFYTIQTVNIPKALGLVNVTTSFENSRR
jgi:hypothetical protein